MRNRHSTLATRTLICRALAPLAMSCAAMPALAAPMAATDPGMVMLAMAEPLLPEPDPAGSSGYPQSSGSTVEPAHSTSRWAVFGQSTFTAMATSGFHAPYAGDASLTPRDLRETFDASIYAGFRPWDGGEIWATGEIDQGFGVGNAHGMAGYASGEAYKLGKAQPYSRVHRLFLRQTFSLGGAITDIDAAPNQLAGRQSADRLVLTAGKFSVVDVFDANKYAHDPRGDFLNWSMIDSGAFDYGGDPWGFTYGAAAELYVGPWTARLGVFNMTDVPGGMETTTDFSFMQVVSEIEHRHTLGKHPGALRVSLWANHGQIGKYSDALVWGRANATEPDVSQVQNARHTRIGGYINAEQEITDTLGLFLRASAADGRYAVFDFTDIDRSISGGLSLTGKSWHRPTDTVAIGVAANGISKQGQAYLAAGGLGVLIGDGQLPHPGTEKIVEASYTWRPNPRMAVTFDTQFVANPAYNRDRGPVGIVGLRLHASF